MLGCGQPSTSVELLHAEASSLAGACPNSSAAFVLALENFSDESQALEVEELRVILDHPNGYQSVIRVRGQDLELSNDGATIASGAEVQVTGSVLFTEVTAYCDAQCNWHTEIDLTFADTAHTLSGDTQSGVWAHTDCY